MLGSTKAHLDTRDLELILGIYPPWSIGSTNLDESEGILEIYIENKSDRFNAAGTKEDLVDGCWQYLTLGAYKCFIHAKIPENSALSEHTISRLQIMQPAFLGHPERNYSNYLRQQVALGQLKGIDVSTLCDIFLLDKNVAKKIQADLRESSSQARMLASLPTETDPVWTNILLEKMDLKTDVLPLKLLLTKLKSRAAISAKNELFPLVIDLRKFFLENASIADIEIDQICGILSRPQQERAQIIKARQKLVLPSIKSAVWIDLLSGRLTLNSLSVPLNLLISRQRSAFIQAHSNAEKVQSVEILRSYFLKNYRALKPELLLINRAMSTRKKSTINLPDSEHEVWQQIIMDDNFVSSDNIAYKLLLSKLRAQIKRGTDPVVKIEAARRIRDFIKQNCNSMQQEVERVLGAVN